MEKYVHSTDGLTVDIGVSLKKHSGEKDWYILNWNPPASSENEVVTCTSFVRNGDSFDAVFTIRQIPEDPATEDDKDAALATLGVDMTENGGAE